MSNYKLICLDMDGILFNVKNIWMETHKVLGTLKEGKALTEKYLHFNYELLEKEVVEKIWKGKDAKPFLDLIDNLQYMDGIKELFDFIKKKNWLSAIISGGSHRAALRINKDFGVKIILANELVIENEKISGEFKSVVKHGHEIKADIVREICRDINIKLDEVIYIGDAIDDLEAFEVVGKSIAFNCDSDKLKKTASVVVDSKDLKDVVKVLENE